LLAGFGENRVKNEKRNIVLGILIIVVSIFFIAIQRKSDLKKNVDIKEGVLDVSGYSFNSHDIVSLNGEWEFYRGHKTFTTQVEKDKEKKYTTFPCLLRNCSVPRSPSNAKKPLQSATFRITVKMPSEKKPMALYVPMIYSSAKIIINNKIVHTVGKTGEKKEVSYPQFKPGVVYLHEIDEKIQLVLQVSNHYYAKGGMTDSIYLGTSEAISTYQRSIVHETYFFVGILFFITMYHILLYILRSSSYSVLYFGLICLFITLRLLSTESILLLYYFPNMPWELLIKIQYISYYLAAISLFLFFYYLFPEELHRNIVRAAIMVIVLFTVITLFSPAIFYSRHISRPFEFFSIFIMINIVVSLIRAVFHRRKGSVIILIGTIILITTMVNDLLHILQKVDTGYFLKYGWLCFVFIQAYVLAVNFSHAFHEIEQLSHEVAGKNISLMSLDKLKDEFLTNTSHELRTPLNGIIGISDSLMQGVTGKLNQQTTYNLDLIHKSAKRLSTLVNDILDFSKMKNSDLILSPVAIDINQLVDMIFSMEAHRINGKIVRLYSSISDNFPLVYADENRVGQILFNLIDNAIKFTESGEIEISARGIIENDKHFAEISVRDTGIGIPQNKLEDVFKSFEQLDGSIARIYGGTGLGLSIIRSLIDLHGGKIRVESQLGEGTNILFTLPLIAEEFGPQTLKIDKQDEMYNQISYPDNNEKSELNASDVDKDLNDMEKNIILAVDDDPINLNVLVNQLTLEGYDIITAESGDQALKYLHENTEFDLVILDIMMPKVSGYDVLKEIRKIYAPYDLPVILLSAKNQVNDIVTGLSYGASDYLSKPFDKNELIARVSTLITLKHAVKESKKLLQMQEELALAKKIQRSLFPVENPIFNNFTIASRCEPVESIGGDFYDFILHDETHLGVVLVDVAGHGIPGALIASMVKVVISIFCETVPEPSEFLSKMNSVLFDKMESLFLTASYMIIDSKKMKLHYARAGHEPLIIINKEQKAIERYTPRGRACGWIQDLKISSKIIDLKKGDRLVLYSDGIIEFHKPDNSMLGAKNFDEFLVDNIALSPQELINALFVQLEEWNTLKTNHHHDDDITLIVIDV